MRKMCDNILQSHSDLVLLGDMNCDPAKSNTIEFICDTYALSNLIKSPTCNKGIVPSLIDVILVSNHRKYMNVLNSKCPLSDFHNIIGAATKRFAPIMKPHNIYYQHKIMERAAKNQNKHRNELKGIHSFELKITDIFFVP